MSIFMDILDIVNSTDRHSLEGLRPNISSLSKQKSGCSFNNQKLLLHCCPQLTV